MTVNIGTGIIKKTNIEMSGGILLFGTAGAAWSKNDLQDSGANTGDIVFSVKQDLVDLFLGSPQVRAASFDAKEDAELKITLYEVDGPQLLKALCGGSNSSTPAGTATESGEVKAMNGTGWHKLIGNDLLANPAPTVQTNTATPATVDAAASTP